jgi:queuine tRNA-ribosyltransferase
MTQEMLEDLGVSLLLANTYHLYLRPGHEPIRRMGGLHSFMAWPHPILTDSGGYQVFSLSDLRKVSDDGVTFRSHLDGSEHFLTPESAAEIQLALGSDIAMVLDECIEALAPRDATAVAMQRTFLWAQRAKSYFAAHGDPQKQWQFGIVQGGTFEDLRRESADQVASLGFPGNAIGGLAVGEPHEMTCAMTEVVAPRLPVAKPRYLMGVGKPEDIPDYVARGVDLMDCVLPTRAARHGCLYTSAGRVLIKNAQYAEDQGPLDESCRCMTCRRYSRAYLRHLFMANELLAHILHTHHNLHFYLDLMRSLRAAIEAGVFSAFAADLRSRLTATG